MVILQQIDKNQMVKLLDAINREGVDNQFWAVSSYENSWNADENLSIVTSFPHYDYWIEYDLRVLIFKI